MVNLVAKVTVYYGAEDPARPGQTFSVEDETEAKVLIARGFAVEDTSVKPDQPVKAKKGG